MTRNIEKIVSQLTLEEKAELCSGSDFWHTKAIERLGIPSIMMTDGPHGLRKQSGPSDHLGINQSEPATCFPSAAGLASSWDRSLMEQVGKAIGEECQAQGVSILLGPGANIKRSPLCGRNFEYFSEDPYLSGEMDAHHIIGVQSQGVGTSLKHFAVNNQEKRRFTINAKVDQRTLHEIYLSGFEGAIRQAKPWTVMCSYNRLNSVYNSENPYLLTEVLRDSWGFEGLVMSDWGAVNERDKALAAGLELEMPSSFGAGAAKIVAAVKAGTLDENVVDRAVGRLLRIIFRAADNEKQNVAYRVEAHHQLARKAAGECMVLLKNQDSVLPLKKSEKIAVLGDFAINPRYQGAGSSHVNPHKLESPLKELKKLAGYAEIRFAQGYKTSGETAMFSPACFTDESDHVDLTLMEEAKKLASECDTAVIFAGLPSTYESEGFDRSHMRMPEGQSELIRQVASVQKNVIVVLSNGAPIEMPWLKDVKGVLEGYLGGQGFGGAAADILFGEVNPSGKLAETFPKRLKDTPCYLYFPGDQENVEYHEGIFVGYRYYDAADVEPLFPFGFGLSYTRFEYSNLICTKKRISEDESLTIQVTVKNAGPIAGKEVVQLYVSDKESSVIRPQKELKGFEKVELNPGEEKTLNFTLSRRAFAFYDTKIDDWRVESGKFTILVGASSRDIRLSDTVEVYVQKEPRTVYTRNTTLKVFFENPKATAKLKMLLAQASKTGLTEESDSSFESLADMPLRSVCLFANRNIEKQIDELLGELNYHSC